MQVSFSYILRVGDCEDIYTMHNMYYDGQVSLKKTTSKPVVLHHEKYILKKKNPIPDGDLYAAAPLYLEGTSLQFRRQAGNQNKLWMYDPWITGR